MSGKSFAGRKVVGAYLAPFELAGAQLVQEVVVCDDGAVFRRYPNDAEWRPGPSVPGTSAAAQEEEAEPLEFVVVDDGGTVQKRLKMGGENAGDG